MAWDVNAPAGTELVKNVDNIIRGDKATLLATLGAEHQFAPDDTSGYHLEGSARLYYGVDGDKDLVTPREGSLYWATDTKTLYVGNDATPCAWVAFHRDAATAQKTAGWASPGPAGSTSSTTFVDVGSDALSQSITLNEGDSGHLLVMATLSAENDTADASIFFNLGIENEGLTSPMTSSTQGLAALMPPQGSGLKARGTVCIVRRTTTALAPASYPAAYKVKVQWRVDIASTASFRMDMSNSLIVRKD